jgi:hypothetical protein
LLENTGHYAIIDSEDYDKVIAYGKWHENSSGYAVKKTRVKGKNISIRMHMLVNNTPIGCGFHTDHINGNRLDNRKENLRAVTPALNVWNRHKARKHTKYDLPAGVSFDKNKGQYVASVVFRRRFKTLDEAIAFTKKGINEI